MLKLDVAPDTLTQLSALVGVFLPLLIAYIVSAKWSKQTKQYVVLAVSAVAAIVISLIREGFAYETVDAFLSSVFVIIGVAQTFYLLLWNRVTAGFIERLENTSPPGLETLGNALSGR